MLELAQCAIVVEKHYSKKAGAPTPMDVEWAKDGSDGELYIIQARPETVASRRKPEALESYALKSTGKVVAAGRAVGEKIATGKVRLISERTRSTRLQAWRGAGRARRPVRIGSR